MTLRLLRAADRRAVPWKNGGGVTREVAAFPAGSTFDDFHWRVSMAEVTADGPFSAFPQVDRILAVLEGALRLRISGLAGLDLSEGSPAASFPGDAEAHAEVLDGPVLDLNVMARRGHVRPSLVVVQVDQPRRLEAIDAPRLVLATGGPMRVEAPAGSYELERFDALLADAPCPDLMIAGAQPTRVHIVTFDPA